MKESSKIFIFPNRVCKVTSWWFQTGIMISNNVSKICWSFPTRWAKPQCMHKNNSLFSSLYFYCHDYCFRSDFHSILLLENILTNTSTLLFSTAPFNWWLMKYYFVGSRSNRSSQKIVLRVEVCTSSNSSQVRAFQRLTQSTKFLDLWLPSFLLDLQLPSFPLDFSFLYFFKFTSCEQLFPFYVRCTEISAWGEAFDLYLYRFH